MQVQRQGKNRKDWDIFLSWVKHLNRPVIAKRRMIILILNICSANHRAKEVDATALP